MKKNSILMLCTLILFSACGNATSPTENTNESIPKITETTEATETSYTEPLSTATPPLNISLPIEDYYITNTGDPANLYYIDESKVLWGCGTNQYGQLGQGTRDYDYHPDLLKIADNVIHVDFSQEGFMIYLTTDNKLYGCGNAGCGALQQLDAFSEFNYLNPDSHAVTEPILLMEDVAYARCGRTDIACLATDGSVWIWGTVWHRGESSYHRKDPLKVLDDAVFVTGGSYNHSALLKDGTVWTWGYNYTGNCGVENKPFISCPTQVAENACMVWTGSLHYNIDCQDITEFDGVYERGLENTIIQKTDGTYWICGANVGDTNKIISSYFEASNYEINCTHEFIPYQWPIQ